MGSGASNQAAKEAIKNSSVAELQAVVKDLPQEQVDRLKEAILKSPRPDAKPEPPCVAIIYYSLYGHVKRMADEIKAGLEAGGINVHIYQVPETLPQEILTKMHAPPKPADVPVMDYEKVALLPQYDGFIFGMSSRFGSMPAQMKAFFDSTGGLWMGGKLVGKPAATFVCTGQQNGGQETTHMNAVTHFAHHGMMYVPLGYQAGAAGQFDLTEVHGGSPWGAGTIAGGNGSRQPSDMELAIAKKQGETFADVVKRTLSPPVERKVKIAIVYYSMYGHIKKLTDHIAKAAKEEGVEVDVYQVRDTLDEEVLKKMHAAPKSDDPYLDHSNLDKLVDYDGIMFGIPTRFGKPCAQIKAFWDSTGSLWQAGKLVGKLTATFASTGTQNGGQETTHLTALTDMVHHGMIYVTLGYQAGAEGQFDLTEIHGGSPYGTGTLAGADGSRQPGEMELKIAAKQAQTFAAKVKLMAK